MMRRIAKVSLLSLFCTSAALTLNTPTPAWADDLVVAAQQQQEPDEHFDNLVTMLSFAVNKYADRPLFGVKKGEVYDWMTYRQFGAHVDDLRAGLASLRVKKNSKVAIIANNSPEWAVSCYATLGLGAAFVPMYTSQSVEEWTYKLIDSQAKVLFVANHAIYEKVKDLPDQIPSLKHIVNLASDDPADAGEAAAHSYQSLMMVGREYPVPAIEPNKDDLMGLIYTSGTTGDPKGVMLSHGNVASTLEALPTIIPIEGERSLSFLPWAHIFGQLAEVHALIRLGNSAALAENPPRSLPADLRMAKPTIFFAVPTVFNRIYDKTNADAVKKGPIKKFLFESWRKVLTQRRNNEHSSFFRRQFASLADGPIKKQIKQAFGGELKITLSGGAKLSPEVAHFINDLGIIVLEGYGMSETSGMISMNTPDARKIGSVGKLFPNVRVTFDRSMMAADDQSGDGEIIVYGPNIMQGYYNKPELTRKEFTEDGGFRTGDVGHLDEDGFLYITGRIKEIYKLENGKYISPAAFEEKVKLSPFIKEAFLYGDNKPHNVMLLAVEPEKLAAFAAEHHIAGDLAEQLNAPAVQELLEGEVAKVSALFPPFVKPAVIKLISDEWSEANGMMTPTLKVKRKAVEGKYKDLLQSLYN